MRKILTVAAGIMVAVATTGLATQKQAQIMFHVVTAEQIAKDFRDDPVAAKKRYNPNPPAPAPAGSGIIHITGVVAARIDNNVYLKNGAGMKVMLQSRRAVKGQLGDKVQAMGRFRSLRGNIIVIDCD